MLVSVKAPDLAAARAVAPGVVGAGLEAAVSPTSAELHERYETRPATAEEFDRLFGHLPADGEG